MHPAMHLMLITVTKQPVCCIDNLPSAHLPKARLATWNCKLFIAKRFTPLLLLNHINLSERGRPITHRKFHQVFSALDLCRGFLSCV